MEKVGGGLLGPDRSEIPRRDGAAAPAATYVGVHPHHPVILYPQGHPDRLALAVGLPLLAVPCIAATVHSAPAYAGPRGKAQAHRAIVDFGDLAGDLGAARR